MLITIWRGNSMAPDPTISPMEDQLFTYGNRRDALIRKPSPHGFQQRRQSVFGTSHHCRHPKSPRHVAGARGIPLVSFSWNGLLSLSQAVWLEPIAGALSATGVAVAAARSRGKLCALRSCITSMPRPDGSARPPRCSPHGLDRRGSTG